MVAERLWNEVGNSYPSCEELFVRKGIVSPGGGTTITAPLILTDTRTVGTSVLGALAIDGVSSPLTGTTRITMRSNNAGSDSSVIRWLRSDNTLRWSFGTDVNGNGNNNLWMFDNAQSIYGFYFPSGAAGDTVGSVRWGIGGRVAYDTATNAMTRRVNNVVRETLDPTQWTLTSGGTVGLTSTGAMQLTSNATVNIDAVGSAMALTAASTMTLLSAGLLTLASSAGAAALTGTTTVTVDAGTTLALNGSDGATLEGAGAGGLALTASAAAMTLTAVTGITLNNSGGAGGVVLGGGADLTSVYGEPAIARQTINGSRTDGVVVLTALLAALDAWGVIIDNTSA